MTDLTDEKQTKRIKYDNEEDLINLFKSFDKDGNGILYVGTFVNAIKAVYEEDLTEEEATKKAMDFDLDGDGYINYYEVARIMVTK